MKNQQQNPNGLHARYFVQKIEVVRNPDFIPNMHTKGQVDNDEYIEVLKPIKKDSEYFLLKLNANGGDIEHIKACRIAVRAYAEAIQHHLPQLAIDIFKKYPLL